MPIDPAVLETMRPPNVRPTCIGDYALFLERRILYGQINFGDGEWACMLNKPGGNVNGEQYTPKLGRLLERTLIDHQMLYIGSNPGKKLKDEATRWIAQHGVNAVWVDKEILPSANVNGELRAFLEALRTRDVVLVGPRHLAELPDDVFGAPRFLEIPDKVAWTVVEQTCERIRRVLKAGDVLLVASGMATNLTIAKLWPEFGRSVGVTMHDVGALFDPYVGIWSRSGYRKESFQKEAILRNLGRT